MSAAVKLDQVVESPAVVEAVAFDAGCAERTEQIEHQHARALRELDAERQAALDEVTAARAEREAAQAKLLTELGKHWQAKIATTIEAWELAPSKHTAADVADVIKDATADIASKVTVRTKVKVKTRVRSTGGHEYEQAQTVERHVPFDYLAERRLKPQDGTLVDLEADKPSAVRAVRRAFKPDAGEFRGEPGLVSDFARAYDSSLVAALDRPARLHQVLAKWSVDLS